MTCRAAWTSTSRGAGRCGRRVGATGGAGGGGRRGGGRLAAPTDAAAARAARKELARLERQLDKVRDRETRLHDQMAAAATDHERVLALDADLRALHGGALRPRGALAGARRDGRVLIAADVSIDRQS